MVDSAEDWNFAGSMPISENTPKYRENDLARPARARFPDYLAEEREVSLGQNKYKAVFAVGRASVNVVYVACVIQGRHRNGGFLGKG